jgi:hypothetical protein
MCLKDVSDKDWEQLRKVPGRRNPPLLRLWIVVDLHTQSLSSLDVVGTRSEPRRVVGYQPLAVREHPGGAGPDPAHDPPEGSLSNRDSADRDEIELLVSHHPSVCPSDAVVRLRCELQFGLPHHTTGMNFRN